MYPLLSTINSPDDLKKLKESELSLLAVEIREFLIETVAKTGGHLASNLGSVELTLALHYCFNSPVDKMVWDVGHQAYTHKILTGRRDAFPTQRQYHGLSGFPKRAESPYDAFGAGHASTALSALWLISWTLFKWNPAVTPGDGLFLGLFMLASRGALLLKD